MNAPEKIYGSPEQFDLEGQYRFILDDKNWKPPMVEYTLSSLTARWVRVKERLPESGKAFLVSLAGGFLTMSYYDGDWWRQSEVITDKVTHWLDGVPPLPEGK